MRSDDSTIATKDVSMLGDDVEDESFVDIPSTNPIQQDAAVTIQVRPHYTIIGVDAGTSTTEMCVTMKAKELAVHDNRAPVDIIVALDVSGSMAGTPLSLCKRTLEMLLRVLLPQDRFGLVTYGSDARVNVPAQKMTAANKHSTLNTIQSLSTRGCTNISAAIGLAALEMTSIDSPNEVRSIFLLTDGLANEGVVDLGGLVELTRNCLVHGARAETTVVEPLQKRGFFSHNFAKTETSTSAVPKNVTTAGGAVSGPPISMHCFGYGVNHNAELLRELATAASGSYYFVENDTSVGSAFGDCLGGVLSVVAQNAVVTIQPCPEALSLGMEIVEVHHDQSIKRENGSHTVTVGDFYAEESRDILVTVKLATPDSPSPTPIPHVTVSLSYTDTLLKRPETTTAVTCAIARPTGSEISDSDAHVSAQWLRVFATREMAQADAMAKDCNLAGARAKIRGVKAKIHAESKEVQDFGMIQELCNDMEDVDESFTSNAVYLAVGSKKMSCARMMHTNQRAARSAPKAGGGGAYSNQQKKNLSTGFRLG